MTTDQIALQIPTILALSLLCTSVAKALLEVWVAPDQHLHDPLVQLMALAIGVGWSFAFSAAYPTTAGGQLQAITSVILGLVGGSGSIGAYHLTTAVKRAAAATPGAQNQSGAGAKDTAHAQTRTLEVPAAAQVSVRLPPGMAPPPTSDVPDVSGGIGVAAVRAQPTTPPPDAAP